MSIESNPAKKKKRIFVGINEVVDVCRLYGRGLEELGFPVTVSLVGWNAPSLDRQGFNHRTIKPGSRPMLLLRLLIELIWAIPRHDVFVFRGRSFFADFVKYKYLSWLGYADLPILKMFGKQIVFLTTGSDVRIVPEFVEELEAKGYTQNADAVREGFIGDEYSTLPGRRSAKIVRWAQAVFTLPSYSQRITGNKFPFWNPIIVEDFEFKIPENRIPVVIHAPSHRKIKGTGLVIEAVEQLKAEGYDFEFTLIEGMDNSKVRSELTNADIVLDQFNLPSYGVFALEAMASGCVVLGQSVPEIDFVMTGSPVVKTGPNDIAANLKNILDDSELRVGLAREGREWVERKHDYRVVTKQFAESAGIND
jgi:glycosyltransferase involved in cell wall biosynthesis